MFMDKCGHPHPIHPSMFGQLRFPDEFPLGIEEAEN